MSLKLYLIRRSRAKVQSDDERGKLTSQSLYTQQVECSMDVRSGKCRSSSADIRKAGRASGRLETSWILRGLIPRNVDKHIEINEHS